MKTVSAAPPDWPKDFPDNWGTRPQFSQYEVLPEAPSFLRAGLLREHSDSEQALWYLNPDSFLVLHVDKLGPEGRLVLTRVSGPIGKVVWTLALPMTSVDAVMRSDGDLYVWGREPVAADGHTEDGEHDHQKLMRIVATGGQSTVIDMTSEGITREAKAIDSPEL